MGEMVNKIHCGDSLTVLRTLPDESIDMCITSPPYYTLRSYGVDGQIGLEYTVAEYIDRMIAVFAEVKRVLKPAGTCWVNLGDTYGGSSNNKPQSLTGEKLRAPVMSNCHKTEKSQPKSLLQIPSRFALTMTDRLGFILRNTIIWHKPNAMPQSADDRFTNDFEYLFFFVKNQTYWFSQQFEAMADDTLRRAHSIDNGKKSKTAVYSGLDNNSTNKWRTKVKNGDVNTRNKRAVWSISTRNNHDAHFATYPETLIETPIMAGCPEGGIVLDPFIGSGTTAVVAKRLGRRYIGIDINPEYVAMAEKLIREYLNGRLF
jgi:DNA modification methylase